MTSDMTVYYKALGPGRAACHGGAGTWPAPTLTDGGEWTPGEWTDWLDNPQPCVRGYHLVTIDQLVKWLADEVWVAEPHPDSPVVEGDGKWVCSSARLVRPTRWGDRLALLFAADCAARVLPIFERERPGDDRPRRAVVAAREFAFGRVGREELAAAWAAARVAAGVAAGDAAWAAARVAAEDAAEEAARVAARAAARVAAWAAAWDAAGDAERRWQNERLALYLADGDTVPPVELAAAGGAS